MQLAFLIRHQREFAQRRCDPVNQQREHVLFPYVIGPGQSFAQQLPRRYPMNAAEAGDEQAFEDAEAVEPEVAEAGIHLRLGMRAR